MYVGGGKCGCGGRLNKGAWFLYTPGNKRPHLELKFKHDKIKHKNCSPDIEFFVCVYLYVSMNTSVTLRRT